jgi:hypothetical protein
MVLVGAAVVLCRPMWGEYRRLGDELRADRAKAVQLRDEIAAQRSAREEQAQLAQSFGPPLADRDREARAAAFRARLGQWAASCGLRVDGMQSRPDTVDANGVVRFPATVTLSGEDRGLVALLAQLRAARETLAIDGLTVRRGAAGGAALSIQLGVVSLALLDRGERHGEPGRPAAGDAAAAVAPGTVPAEDAVIVDRKLFAPLPPPSAAPAAQDLVATRPPSPSGEASPTGAPEEPQPCPTSCAPRATRATIPASLAPRTTPMATPRPAPVVAANPNAAPAPQPLFMTGLVEIGSGSRVVIENGDKHQSRVVAPGQTAFGQEVVAIDAAHRRVILRPVGNKAAKAIELKLGEKDKVRPQGKPVRREESRGAGGPSGEGTD